VKFYKDNFSTRDKHQKIVEYAKKWTEPAREIGQDGQPHPIGLGAQAAGSPPFFPGTRVFYFHVRSENFREVKRKRWVLGHSFSVYLKE
jgi:hypothetical protein